MTQFRGLNCVEFEESGHAYLRVDTSVWCDEESDDYRRMLAIDVPLIAIYQSIPFIWGALLIWQRRRLNPGYSNDQASRRKRDSDPVIAPLVSGGLPPLGVVPCSHHPFRPGPALPLRRQPGGSVGVRRL